MSGTQVFDWDWASFSGMLSINLCRGVQRHELLVMIDFRRRSPDEGIVKAQKLTAPFKITLGKVLLSSPGLLTEFLERLYLGKPCLYCLVFPQDNYLQVEQAFDGIIFRHGIKEVDFEYEVVVSTQAPAGIMDLLPRDFNSSKRSA